MSRNHSHFKTNLHFYENKCNFSLQKQTVKIQKQKANASITISAFFTLPLFQNRLSNLYKAERWSNLRGRSKNTEICGVTTECHVTNSRGLHYIASKTMLQTDIKTIDLTSEIFLGHRKLYIPTYRKC